MTGRSVMRQGAAGPDALSSGRESIINGEVVIDLSIISSRNGLLRYLKTRIATHNRATTPPTTPPAIAGMFGLRVDDALAEGRDSSTGVEDMGVDVGVAGRSSGL